MNDKQTLTLEAGKYYRTRDGQKAFVSAVSLPNPFGGIEDPYPVIGFVEGSNAVPSWTSCGRVLMEGEREHDLVAEWVEPRRLNGWIATDGNICGPVRASREGAIKAFRRENAVESIIACIEIDVLEGHGLNREGA